MLAYSPQATLDRKMIYNFIWIYLVQHCIRKLPVKCCSWLRYNCYEEDKFSVVQICLRQYCTRKLLVQYCLKSAQMYFCRKTGNWVLYHWTILTLFVQCWVRSSFEACGTAMNSSQLWLEEPFEYQFDVIVLAETQHNDDNPSFVGGILSGYLKCESTSGTTKKWGCGLYIKNTIP